MTHLRDELPIGLHHGDATEELLQVVGQLGTAGVARVHRHEDADLLVELDRLADEADLLLALRETSLF